MTRLNQLVHPWAYDGWQPDGDPFGAGTDGVIIEPVYAVHIAASLEAMDKQGYWRPISSPVLIHTPEIKKNYRIPLLLRVALYGQYSLELSKGAEHAVDPEQAAMESSSASTGVSGD